jgi:hypothetical protein
VAKTSVLINFIAFQVGWFAAVLGAGRGLPWLGVVVVPLVLLLNIFLSGKWRQEVLVAFAAAAMGLVFDSTMTSIGAFTPVPYGLPRPLSPLWMIMLWVNQALTLDSCMGWLRGRYWLGAAFGAIGGPLAYLGGAKLGAAAIPSSADMMILAVAWAAAFPALMAVEALIRRRTSAD